MPRRRSRQVGRLLVASFAVAVLFLQGAARAEQLPLRAYTTADGLAHDFVVHISEDSRGYLWIGTADGLSWFDGYEFVNYGVADGLPSPSVSTVLEEVDGTYWIGTARGLCRLDPSVLPGSESPSRPRLSCSPVGGTPRADSVTDLLRDRERRLWVATDGGLFLRRTEGPEAVYEKIALPLAQDESNERVGDLAEGADGSLWIAFWQGVARRTPSGRMIRYRLPPADPRDFGLSLLSDSKGRVWIGWERLHVLVPETPPSTERTAVDLAAHGAREDGPLPATPGDVRVFGGPLDEARRGAPTLRGSGSGPSARSVSSPLFNRVYVLAETADGSIWAGTDSGLCIVEGEHLRCHTQTEGLREPSVRVLAEDRHGSLWLGAESSGLIRMARGGLTRFTRADSLADERIDAIVSDEDGDVYVASGLNTWLHRVDGGRLHPRRIDTNAGIEERGWGWNQVVLKDREGDWWLTSGEGLLRFPGTVPFEALDRTLPKAIYARDDGLPGDNVFRIYEDSRGDVWVGTLDGEKNLSRWDRATGRFDVHSFPEPVANHAPTAFTEDREGNLWIGFYTGGLARYHDGRFDLFPQGDLLPHGLLFDLFVDSAGRLWVATSRGGAARLDDPGAASPAFVWWTTREGLASNQVQCVAEDRWGRIYLGTGRGVNRLDPGTGAIRHLTTADGLTHNNVRIAHTDARGDIWFGTLSGVTRLQPQPDREEPAPRVMIRGLEIDGTSRALPDLGEKAIERLDLGPSQNRITIGFAAPSFAPAESLRYQFRLEGADEDWSEPSPLRSVHFAGLSPGSYTFLVRAVTAGGIVSAEPASVSFTIAPPIWRRWWFTAASAVALLALAVAAHRVRVARAVALERIRTRIATDLHDDLGASLSRISILSEVALRKMDGGPAEARSQLAVIGETARELAEAMSDTVWSIDPRRDDLGSLVARLRHFASDVLEGREIRWSLEVPEDLQRIRLPAVTRRHLFLILKEAVNNVARHSQAASATISIRVKGGAIEAEVADDGRGFATQGAPGESVDVKVADDGRGLTAEEDPGASLRADVNDDRPGFSASEGAGETIRSQATDKEEGPPARWSAGGSAGAVGILSAGVGNGLRNMKGRAEAAGGVFTIESKPGRGTRLTARLPLH